jgi:uncharacterized protein
MSDGPRGGTHEGGLWATRLTIFLTEDDRIGHRSAHEVVLQRAREDGMLGATVWRGVEGFGRRGSLRTTRFPDLGRGLPLAIELIDDPERIEAFLSVVEELGATGLVTKERVLVARRGAGDRLGLDDPSPNLEP